MNYSIRETESSELYQPRNAIVRSHAAVLLAVMLGQTFILYVQYVQTSIVSLPHPWALLEWAAVWH